MDQLVKLPNRVADRQRFYQNSVRPLYYRSPGSSVYIKLWFAGLFAGLGGITYGAVQMINGKPT